MSQGTMLGALAGSVLLLLAGVVAGPLTGAEHRVEPPRASVEVWRGVLTVGGTAGDDVIYVESASSSDELLVRVNGELYVFPMQSRVVVYAGDGDDLVSASEELDVPVWFHGQDGDDGLRGGRGEDVLEGGADDDKLHGGDGDDTLYGGDGDDRLYGDDGSDLLYGDDGDDQLYGGCGDDALHGGDGDDHLHATQGDDLVDGGDGEDHIHLN